MLKLKLKTNIKTKTIKNHRKSIKYVKTIKTLQKNAKKLKFSSSGASSEKTLILLGGSGNVGKEFNKYFANKKYKVINIDYNKNNDIQDNLQILLKDSLTSKSQQVEIESKLNDLCNGEYLGIVNVAGGWRGGNIESDDLIGDTDIMLQQNLYSSLLAARLASKNKNSNGLLCLFGSNGINDKKSAIEMLPYSISKNSVHYVMDLLKETPLSNGNKVVGVLPTTIDTATNREFMPDADTSNWTKPEVIADDIHGWLQDVKSVENGHLKIF